MPGEPGILEFSTLVEFSFRLLLQSDQNIVIQNLEAVLIDNQTANVIERFRKCKSFFDYFTLRIDLKNAFLVLAHGIQLAFVNSHTGDIQFA